MNYYVGLYIILGKVGERNYETLRTDPNTKETRCRDGKLEETRG
jgi:hypothetical protein